MILSHWNVRSSKAGTPTYSLLQFSVWSRLTHRSHTHTPTHTHLLNGRMSETKGERRVQEEVEENEDRKLKKEARARLRESHRLEGRLTWGLFPTLCLRGTECSGHLEVIKPQRPLGGWILT